MFVFLTRDFPNCSKIQEHSCSFNLLLKRALKDLILRPNISSQFSLLINLALLNLLNALVQRGKKNNPLSAVVALGHSASALNCAC